MQNFIRKHLILTVLFIIAFYGVLFVMFPKTMLAVTLFEALVLHFNRHKINAFWAR